MILAQFELISIHPFIIVDGTSRVSSDFRFKLLLIQATSSSTAKAQCIYHKRTDTHRGNTYGSSLLQKRFSATNRIGSTKSTSFKSLNSHIHAIAATKWKTFSNKYMCCSTCIHEILLQRCRSCFFGRCTSYMDGVNHISSCFYTCRAFTYASRM